MDALEISRTGLDVEWQRLQVIAQNLANINTTRDAAGGAYRPQRLLSGPQAEFASIIRGAPKGVAVQGMAAAGTAGRRVHEPDHPHADADGFVTYPGIDHAGEMTLLIKTSRAYEANLTAFSIAQQMYARALDLGNKA
ncbi:flagellar basal body rod protein FlgC [Sphingomonas koreensis]